MGQNLTQKKRFIGSLLRNSRKICYSRVTKKNHRVKTLTLTKNPLYSHSCIL